MALFGSSEGVGGMFDNLKSRLGFNGDHSDDDSRYGNDGYDDEYDDYDDYDDEYGDDGYNSYDGGYDDYEDNRPVGGYRPATAGSGRTGRSSRQSNDFPPLVSHQDVKDHTYESEWARRSANEAAAEARGSRTVLDETVPPVSSPAHNAAIRDSRLRSEGLDSLFEPTTPATDAGYAPAAMSASRSVSILKPIAYGDVARIAKSVRAGDVVVLSLRNTPDNLYTRILDFSFGVASALDANVECPGEKVYAIARGAELSEAEKRYLRNQGVL